MQHFDIMLLLNKRFTGEITAEESALLDAWVADSPENTLLAEQYQRAWDAATPSSKAFDMDMDAEFSRLLARLDVPERPQARVVPIGHRVLRVAAALAFLLLATWGYREFAAAEPPLLVEKAQGVEKQLLKLPDGSKVWLRQNAVLQYPESFSGQERRVKLSGEAFFEVAHRDEQPFRVELEQGGLVEVLGTQFNVRTAVQNTETCIVVREGKVRYLPTGTGAGAVLSARDRAVCRYGTEQVVLSKATTFNELAWQTGQLEFDSTPIREVVADLENHYGVKIELLNPAMHNCTHTALVYDLPVAAVLESLAVIYHFQVTQPSPGQFRLAGGVCKK